MHSARTAPKNKSTQRPRRPRMFLHANAMPLVALQFVCFVNFVEGDFTNMCEVADERFQ